MTGAVSLKQKTNDEDDSSLLDDLIDNEAVMQEDQADGRELEVINPNLAKEKGSQNNKINKSDPKFAEVNALMSKYDKAEERVRWLNSPEFL